MFNKNQMPRTIYSDIPVKRVKKYNIIPLVIFIVLFLGGGYLLYSWYFGRQFKPLTANLFFTKSPLEIKGTDQKLESGGSATEGTVIQTPFDEDRAIFFIGKDITVRLMSLSRIKFLVLKRRPRTEEQIVEIELEKGVIWITNENPSDLFYIRYPFADVKIKDKCQVEFRTTEAGSLEILCWSGVVDIIPSIQKDKPIEISKMQRTIIKKAGTMAAPYEIVAKDMNVWEAWNLETDTKEIISGIVPTFTEAFKAQRKKLKITGGFSGKIIVTPKTLISGKQEYLYWREVGISGDSKIIISCREDVIFKSKAGTMNLKLSFRNDGKETAKNLEIAVEALDGSSRVLGRVQEKLPVLKPQDSTEMNFRIEDVPDAINYRIRVLFP